MKYAVINNKFVKEKDAKISIQDRGLRFGDGLFETIKIENSTPKYFELHLKRLEQGMKTIKIAYKISEIKAKSLKLIDKNKQKSGFLRIMLTRGSGSLGYLPTNQTPTLIIETLDQRPIKKEPYKLIISDIQKISVSALPIEYKLNQGLNSTLAIIDAKEKGFDDAIMLNEKHEICETTGANIFFVRKNKTYTPDLKCGLLNGVMRQVIMGKEKIIEKKIKPKHLKKFDRIFITNINLGKKEVELINQNNKIIWQKTPL